MKTAQLSIFLFFISFMGAFYMQTPHYQLPIKGKLAEYFPPFLIQRASNPYKNTHFEPDAACPEVERRLFYELGEKETFPKYNPVGQLRVINAAHFSPAFMAYKDTAAEPKPAYYIQKDSVRAGFYCQTFGYFSYLPIYGKADKNGVVPSKLLFNEYIETRVFYDSQLSLTQGKNPKVWAVGKSEKSKNPKCSEQPDACCSGNVVYYFSNGTQVKAYDLGGLGCHFNTSLYVMPSGNRILIGQKGGDTKFFYADGEEVGKFYNAEVVVFKEKDGFAIFYDTNPKTNRYFLWQGKTFQTHDKSHFTFAPDGSRFCEKYAENGKNYLRFSHSQSREISEPLLSFFWDRQRNQFAWVCDQKGTFSMHWEEDSSILIPKIVPNLSLSEEPIHNKNGALAWTYGANNLHYVLYRSEKGIFYWYQTNTNYLGFTQNDDFFYQKGYQYATNHADIVFPAAQTSYNLCADMSSFYFFQPNLGVSLSAGSLSWTDGYVCKETIIDYYTQAVNLFWRESERRVYWFGMEEKKVYLYRRKVL